MSRPETHRMRPGQQGCVAGRSKRCRRSTREPAALTCRVSPRSRRTPSYQPCPAGTQSSAASRAKRRTLLRRDTLARGDPPFAPVLGSKHLSQEAQLPSYAADEPRSRPGARPPGRGHHPINPMPVGTRPIHPGWTMPCLALQSNIRYTQAKDRSCATPTARRHGGSGREGGMAWRCPNTSSGCWPRSSRI
jgi:hypothetical protein